MATVLELAILSMDVYEQHSTAGHTGLNIGEGVGSYNPGTTSDVGNFFAIEYTNGTDTVIAYEGSTTSIDILNSIQTLVNAPSEQHRQAALFYQNRAAVHGSDIILTGHSLGGSQAGFVGALYGSTSVLFNNVGFLGTANHVRDVASGVGLSFSETLTPEYRNTYFGGNAPPGSLDTANISGVAMRGGEVAA